MSVELKLEEVRDITALMHWRTEVIQHVFGERPDEKLMGANRHYYEEHIADGSHFAIVASYGGADCGCGAVCFTDELPSPDNPTGRCGYLMNIYVREPFRRRGVAHAIVERLIEESQNRACGKIYLETTDDGRPVYRSLGFDDLPGMMKFQIRTSL